MLILLDPIDLHCLTKTFDRIKKVIQVWDNIRVFFGELSYPNLAVTPEQQIDSAERVNKKRCFCFM